MFNREQRKTAAQIEAVFERLNMGESGYSKGEFYEGEFFIRSDLALVVLNKKNEILISFADHTRPAHAALYALLLDEIEDSSLFICEDYKTDEKGSMLLDNRDLNSTGEIIWDDKRMYYSMLKSKVANIVVRKKDKK